MYKMGFWGDFGQGFKMGWNGTGAVFKKAAPLMALTGPAGLAAAGVSMALPTLHKGGRNTRTRVVRLRKGEVVVKRKGAKRKGKKPGPKKGSHNKKGCGCKRK
jgi:hypothetical protein